MLMASCASSQTNPKQTGDDENTSVEESSSAETSSIAILSKLTPELKKELSLDGYVFNVLISPANDDWTISDLVADDNTGDVMSDAVFKRNQWLEANFGFEIKADYSSNTAVPELTTLILSDDHTYDAFFPMGYTAATAVGQGLLYNLKDLKYLDLDNGCWSHMLSDSLEIDGKLFYAAGAISTNSYDALTFVMFNKPLQKSNNLEDPYQLVLDGKWTFDKFAEMASQVSSDLNGDTKMDADDQYGLVWQQTVGVMPFIYGMGEMSVKPNESGIPTINIDSERFIQVYNKIRDTIADKTVFYAGDDDVIFKMFYEGRSLFYIEVMERAKQLRPYELDFGFLPLPKYDENQKEYIQYVNGWCLSPIVVAKNNSNPDRTGFIIEAIAEASKEYLVTPYYEKILYGKTIRDDESI